MRGRQLGRSGARLLRCLCHATDGVFATNTSLNSLSIPSSRASAAACMSCQPSGMAFSGPSQRHFSSLPPYTEMTMPALSPTMTQGNLVKWMVKEGQAVAPGDVLAEVETDKATLSWENQDDGFVAKLLVPEGAQGLAVGTPVALIVEEEEAVPAFKDFAAGAAGGTAPVADAAQPAAAGPSQAAAAGGAKDDSYYSSLPAHGDLTMPALSPTMTQGSLVRWLVKEGQAVAPGDVLAEIETDKATLSWENQDDGFVAKLLVPEGTHGIAVGTPVAVLVEEEEALAAFADYVPRGAAAASGGEPGAAAAAAAPAQHEVHEVNSRIGPAARTLLEESHLPLSAVRPTGPNHIVTKGDVLAAIAAAAAGKGAGQAAPLQTAQQPPAAPKPAPKPAAAAAAAAPATPVAPSPVTAAPGRIGRRGAQPYVDIPNSQIRKVIASRLLESKRSIPHMYLSADVELDGVGALREALKQQGSKVSVNDCVIKAVALALAEVPEANSRWDAATAEAVGFPSVDVAVAVATPTGLITPIVKSANTKSVVQISGEVRDLAARARANKLLPEEFQGGSFTISNLGMFGVDKFFAIINPPQACIMAVGGARSVPVMRPGGQLASTTQMTVTLSADQRVYDGEVASKFLDAFKRHMAAPFTLMQ